MSRGGRRNNPAPGGSSSSWNNPAPGGNIEGEDHAVAKNRNVGRPAGASDPDARWFINAGSMVTLTDVFRGGRNNKCFSRLGLYDLWPSCPILIHRKQPRLLAGTRLTRTPCSGWRSWLPDGLSGNPGPWREGGRSLDASRARTHVHVLS